MPANLEQWTLTILVCIAIITGFAAIIVDLKTKKKPSTREDEIIRLLESGISIKYGSASSDGETVGTVYVNGVMQTSRSQDFKIIENLMLTGKTRYINNIPPPRNKCGAIELVKPQVKGLFDPPKYL